MRRMHSFCLQNPETPATFFLGRPNRQYGPLGTGAVER